MTPDEIRDLQLAIPPRPATLRTIDDFRRDARWHELQAMRGYPSAPYDRWVAANYRLAAQRRRAGGFAAPWDPKLDVSGPKPRIDPTTGKPLPPKERETRKGTDHDGPSDNRKATGAFYTPTELVDCLLDTALEPVIEEQMAEPDPVEALLGLKLCDPAVGCGQFPLWAARRIALRVAQLRCSTYGDPPEDEYRRALWEVVDRCIYAVDINPYAVEMTKIVLQMDCAIAGRPLPLIEPNIQCGNAVLGATPKLMEQGVPDEAWAAIRGDDPKVASALRKRNKQEREQALAEARESARERQKKTVARHRQAIEEAKDARRTG